MKANREEYAIDRQIHSNYNRFFEYMVRSIIIIIMQVHRYFEKDRVVRGDVTDGKTEWFLLDYSVMEKGIRNIYMQILDVLT